MDDGTFASRIGVSREFVRLLRKGRRGPSEKTMRRIRAATRGEVTRRDFGKE